MKKINLLFLFIVILGAFLRFVALASIPNSLNVDEQALGYNAFSLLKTGLDEHGKFFPISLESYGDWKLIGYPLLAIPFITLMGLNELSVRMPSALAGSLQIILIYFIVLKLTKKQLAALLASFFLTFNPWSIYFSRMAYEVNAGTTFFLGGFLALLHYFEETKRKWSFLLACCLLSLTMFVYHSYIIFIPLFCIGVGITHRKYFKNNVFTWLGISILGIAIYLVGSSSVLSSSGKLSSLAVWNDRNTIYSKADIFRIDGSSDKFLGRLFYSKPFAIVSQVAQNYVATFSPVFLFQTGGEKLVNSLGYFGNFYLVDVVLLFLGIVFLSSQKIFFKNLLIIWLLVGIIPSAITQDAPSSTRLYLLMPFFIIIMASGAAYLSNFWKRNWIWKISIATFIGVYALNVAFFLDAYFLHINYQKARILHYGYKQIVELAKQYPHDAIVVYDPQNFPYMSFLFYLKYDPTLFRKEVVYYPPKFADFDEVRSFGRFSFVDKIDYTNLQDNTMYIDYRGIRKEDLTIDLPDGKPIFKYFFKQ